MSAPDDYARMIGLLVGVRDELELAGRSPGKFITITRQVQEQILNDIGIVARMVCDANWPSGRE
jgi:hypothetical protein